ncbi:MAG: glutamate formimidoyltransferase [bacterium]
MVRLVECVPNFSEGRDPAKIEMITREIASTSGVTLLDVDPGKDTNRTVVTFVGSPEGVVEAAFKAIAKAQEVIDMRKHKGAHPRIGATDVCPFIPISGITMEECVGLAHALGRLVGEELGIPVYMYEYAATSPQRKNLANIREGEYEGLPEKIKLPEWKPDYGPREFNPSAGATIIGAREFLIAYNINLNTRDVKIAKEIAFAIRERGRTRKEPDGTKVTIPGKLKECKAVGWYMENFGRAQISINLTNYKVTPPHLVFDECSRLAEELGARVTGSELVGLIPLEPMLLAGRHYLRKQGKYTGVPDKELIHIAILSLGLNDLYPFEPEKKIIDYRVSNPKSLAKMQTGDLVDLVSSDAPAPGGGSVAALCGALGCALTSMVASLTFGKKGYEQVQDDVERIGTRAQTLKKDFLSCVDRDTDAFNKVMEAMRLPKKTEEEIAQRKISLEEATKQATLVPLNVLRLCLEAAEIAEQIAQMGNKNSVSDAGVAGAVVRAAAEGAYLNVCINLPGISDQSFREKVLGEAEKLRGQAIEIAERAQQLAREIILRGQA